MNHFYGHFASYTSRARINGPVRVLCKPRLVSSAACFSRINGPIDTRRASLVSAEDAGIYITFKAHVEHLVQEA